MATDHSSSFRLEELEPSPVEETPPNSYQKEYFPSSHGAASTPGPSRPNQPGLSSHSPIWYLTRIQKYSSYVFTAFGVAHMTNTSLLPLITQSVPTSEPYLLLTRPYYQGIPAEPLLIIAPLAAHIASGLALHIYRRNLNAKRYGAETRADKKRFSAKFWPNVSGISKLGFLFTPLLLGHTFINRGIPKQFPGGSSNINLSYVSHAFARHPAVSWVGFTALIGVGVWHMTWGWAKWLGWTPEQATSGHGSVDRGLAMKRRWYVINGIAAAVAGLWMAGGLGVIGRGGPASGFTGREYDEMYRRIPLVGRWM
ncbi:hypothetical protein MBLNU230_g3345t1 [Neophaeotheca triangularis]